MRQIVCLFAQLVLQLIHLGAAALQVLPDPVGGLALSSQLGLQLRCLGLERLLSHASVARKMIMRDARVRGILFDRCHAPLQFLHQPARLTQLSSQHILLCPGSGARIASFLQVGPRLKGCKVCRLVGTLKPRHQLCDAHRALLRALPAKVHLLA